MTDNPIDDGSSSRRAYLFGFATTSTSASVLDVRALCTGIHDVGAGSGNLPPFEVTTMLGATAEHAASATLGSSNPDLAAAIEILQTLEPVAPFGAQRIPIWVASDLDTPIRDTADAWLRLTLLSRRVCQPNSINLDGIFSQLPIVVWTNAGPCEAELFERAQAEAAAHGKPLMVRGVDKFPCMLDYVVPSGVRIAVAERVRLGAYLAPGTTVMHEGFVNFNAGTLGACMVEGRISQGVTVDDATDIGGSASILGTLSGGGKEVIRIGRECLLGANSGLGISLGDQCVVEAGLYLTAGTIVTLPDGTSAKARELSGVSNLLFRRNSMSGVVEAVPNRAQWGGLNSALHTTS